MEGLEMAEQDNIKKKQEPRSHTEKSANTATGDSTSKGASVEPILGGMILGIVILEDGTSCR